MVRNENCGIVVGMSNYTIDYTKGYSIAITVKGDKNGTGEHAKEIRLDTQDFICIVCPRSCYESESTGDAFSRPGVYVLVGEKETGEQTIYVGKAGVLKTRISGRDWRQVIVFTTKVNDKDDCLDDAKRSGIESLLIAKVKDEKYSVDQQDSKALITSASKRYFNMIGIVWPYLGLDTPPKDIVDQAAEVDAEFSAAENKATIRWKIPAKDTDIDHWAEGRRKHNNQKHKFEILKGSYVRKDVAEHLNSPQYSHIIEQRTKLLACCENLGNIYRLINEDFSFTSKLAAKAATAGRYSVDEEE